jgi:uncharacterized protein YceH (UPF0502 family)
MNSEDDRLLLDPAEIRVLGALVEKAVTTPDYYPLSLNALVNACNQSSNRHPVVEFGEPTVLRALEGLRNRKLVFLFEGAGSRVARYGQKFSDTLGLSPAESAALCVLMLRGPQTTGEIRARSGRLHEFASLDEVESTLQSLAARAPQPFVTRLPRQTGFKEPRYAHLLGGPPSDLALHEGEPEAQPGTGVDSPENDRVAQLTLEVAELRRELGDLKTQFADFRKQLE